MNRKQAEQYLKTIFELRNKLYLVRNEEKAQPILKELDRLFESQPKKLYKYSALSEYTFDAIENNYLFICPANKLDDQFECCVNEPFKEKTKNKKRIDNRFVKQLIKIARELQQSLDDEDVKTIVRGCVRNLQIVDKDYFRKSENRKIIALLAKKDKRKQLIAMSNKDYYRKLCFSNDQEDINEFRKILPRLILETWSKAKKNDVTDALINRASELQKTTGIGSLTECNKSQVMWEMYANHYKGVCIEYNTSTEKMKGAVYPVVYGNKNQTDLVSLLIMTHLENFLFGISNGRINSVKNERQFMTKLLLTKYKEWSFQKEWRMLGNPGDKHKVPKIKRVYIGKNINKEDEIKLVKIAKEKKIELFRQLDNYETLEIKYEKIL